MPELIERLARLHDGNPGPVSDTAVAADLRRGRAALIARRRRRAGVGGAAMLGVVTVGSLTWAAVAHDPATRTVTAERTVVVTAPPRSTPSTSVAPPKIITARLVAYNGKQARGYEIKYVPDGYVVQGVSASVLDIADADDTTPLDSFVNKLVVMLDDHASDGTGMQVLVGDKPGFLQASDGVTLLRYEDGKHHVTVQMWNTIHLTRAQLIRFAEGITVTADAVTGHG